MDNLGARKARMYRAEHRLSQEAMADLLSEPGLLNVDQAMVSRAEGGGPKPPSAALRMRYAKVCGIDVRDFLTRVADDGGSVDTAPDGTPFDVAEREGLAPNGGEAA